MVVVMGWGMVLVLQVVGTVEKNNQQFFFLQQNQLTCTIQLSRATVHYF